jgi:imidazolonepropionase-like amidohydrolase
MGGERWICNATLIDGLGNPAIERGAIAIVDGRITAIGPDLAPPPGVDVLDAGGRTVVPGFINLHSHLIRRKRPDDPPKMSTVAEVVRGVRNAREALGQGITTARELGARDHLDIELRDLIDQGGVPGPRIFASGRPITRTGGHNHEFSREADGPDEVRKAVRAELKAGCDVLKVMASWGGIEIGQEHRRLRLPGIPPPTYAAYTVEEMRAACEEAHAANKRVTVHAESSPAILRAVEAGVDSVEHATHLTDEAARAMKAAGTYLVPTISTVYNRLSNADSGVGADWGGDVMYWVRNATERWMQSLRRAVEHGVTIATGTDAGGDIVMEMQLIHQAGLSRLEAIRAGTGRAAETLGRVDFGALEVGRWADLVLVDGRPDHDLACLATVWKVYRAGEAQPVGSAVKADAPPGAFPI